MMIRRHHAVPPHLRDSFRIVTLTGVTGVVLAAIDRPFWALGAYALMGAAVVSAFLGRPRTGGQR